jgi:nicotinate phosphoribosyltransferase
LAGPKQVFRQKDDQGFFQRDLIGLHDDSVAGSESLLVSVMRDGKRLVEPEPLDRIQRRFRREFGQLPEIYKDIDGSRKYPVAIAPRLQELQDLVREEIREKELTPVEWN